MRFRAASFRVLLLWGLTACGADVSDAGERGELGERGRDAELGQLAQGIFGGDLDPDHPEVMLLFDQAGLVCTGTNIRSEDGSAFLLTAAHCVTEEVGGGIALLPPEQLLVVPGDDFILSPVAFLATAVAVEPNYTGGFAADDIAVVRFFTGTEPAPPALEPVSAAEDALAVADELLLIGYGDTEAGGVNTERRRVSRDVAGLDDELVVYSQEDGSGACFGDSGGPGLANVNGEERVAAIVSGGIEGAGQAPCASGIGVAMRVSAYEGFIDAALALLAQ